MAAIRTQYELAALDPQRYEAAGGEFDRPMDPALMGGGNTMQDLSTLGMDPRLMGQYAEDALGAFKPLDYETPYLAADQAARQQQLALSQQLAARGQGGPTGPSLAELQMRQAMQQAASQQMGMAAGATGANRALAQRGAAANIAQMQQGAAGQGAMLRAQEEQQRQAMQLQALQAAGGLVGQQRGQSLEEAMSRAGLQMDTRQQQLAGWQAQQDVAARYRQMQMGGAEAEMAAGLQAQAMQQEREQQQRIFIEARRQQQLEAMRYSDEGARQRSGQIASTAGAVGGKVADYYTGGGYSGAKKVGGAAKSAGEEYKL